MDETSIATTIIATRQSRLALWQAEHVKSLLETRFGRRVDLLGMTTRGDEILDRALSKVGGKGLFVKELETALADGRAHLAVHSLKDVPMDLPDGFELAAVLEREDPRDALVSNRFTELASLPEGACVGTSSLRRVSQLLAMRPDLRIEPLRGNVNTRLRKLDDGDYDAIVLAAAGLGRLGLGGRITQYFGIDVMVPAGAQGALGIETRADVDGTLRRHLAELTHRPTLLAATAERAVSRALGGSCSMPLAAYAVLNGDKMHLSVALGHATATDQPLLRLEIDGDVTDEDSAKSLGETAAARLQDQGAARYLGDAN